MRAELDSIASLGLDHIRIFLIWPHIQPSRTLIRRAGIRDVGRVVDAAAEVGLSVAVTVGNETDQFALDQHPEPHRLTPNRDGAVARSHA